MSGKLKHKRDMSLLMRLPGLSGSETRAVWLRAGVEVRSDRGSLVSFHAEPGHRE